MQDIMMVWYASQILDGLEGALAVGDCIDTACIKIADGGELWWGENANLARELRARDWNIETWEFDYGYQNEAYLNNLQGILNYAGSVRHILNCETAWETNMGLAWLYRALKLGQYVPVDVMPMPMLGYRNTAALRLAEVVGNLIPMFYWPDFSPPFDKVDTLLEDWYSGRWLRAPDAAVLSFSAPVDDILRVREQLAERGVNRIYYWAWHTAPAEFWEKMREIKNPTVKA